MTWRVLEGDVVSWLGALPADHFHCCVTSPPYWGLRGYLPADSQLAARVVHSST